MKSIRIFHSKYYNDDNYIARWLEGDTAFYQKHFVNSDMVYELNFSYPQSQEVYYMPILNHMVDSFFMPPQETKSEKIIDVSWKAIDYGGDFFHLYVTLNGETDYYVGYFFGEDFTTERDGEVWYADVPENAVSYFRGMWTGAGEWFYMYRKSDTELAIMNHTFEYKKDWNKQEEYKEILTIPLEKEGQIQIEDSIIIREMYDWGNFTSELIIYDSFVLGGTERWSKWIPNNKLRYETELSGDMGFRLFENGQYIDTVAVYYDGFLGESITVTYKGKAFSGFAINNILPLYFSEKILIETSSIIYQDYIAQILTDNGLEGEPVYISEVIKTDIEGNGEDEVLITATNVEDKNKVKGQYSVVVMRKIIDGEVKSIFLVKDIKTILPTDSNTELIYKYKLCEVADYEFKMILTT